ncbi:MAG: Vitamin K epoxide reductase family [uncultured bacterium (gcode 4)]|uniref:Vitamin K epoxide reductase family n=1 Tax=uncultured bacterium (gcode 4) TaxID=1234023 RepID=K1YH82_9BACT|nr:MAG: Vitamin K epoxide reductase family [uncultured bacterium (gcode 4)]
MKKIALLWIFSVIFFAGCAQQTPPQNLDTFAQCLTTKWVTMYGSVTCSHCLNQKETFGKSFQYITYVECTKEPERCSALKWVPTWEMPGAIYLEGEQTLSALAKASDCPLE